MVVPKTNMSLAEKNLEKKINFDGVLTEYMRFWKFYIRLNKNAKNVLNFL